MEWKKLKNQMKEGSFMRQFETKNEASIILHLVLFKKYDCFGLFRFTIPLGNKSSKSPF